MKQDQPHARAKAAAKKKNYTSQNALLSIVLLFLVMPELAHAAAQPWDNFIAGVTGIFTGGLARGIAILVIIIMGVLAWLGKLSWKLVGGFLGGMVLVFGAAAIVDFFIATV